MRKYRIVNLIICGFLLLTCTTGSARSGVQGSVSLSVSNPYCTQASPASPTCMIIVRDIHATSSDPDFLGVQITVNGKTRAFFSNFFENSVQISNMMTGNGLQVICGGPNASGVPDYGFQYQVGISAAFSSSSSTTDIANVNCPFYEDRLYLPTVRR